MGKSKSRHSKYLAQYRKERKRVQQFIRRAEKRGYIFDENVLPAIPKNITKSSVNRLQKLTADVLYQKASKVDYETGELLTGVKGREVERSNAAKKAAQTRKSMRQNIKIPSLGRGVKAKSSDYKRFPTESDILINNWYAELEGLQNATYYRALKAWMDRAVVQFGPGAVAQMLKTAYENGYQLSWEIAYKGSSFEDYTRILIGYIPDVGQYGKDTFWDNLEQTEDWDTNFSPTR